MSLQTVQSLQYLRIVSVKEFNEISGEQPPQTDRQTDAFIATTAVSTGSSSGKKKSFGL